MARSRQYAEAVSCLSPEQFRGTRSGTEPRVLANISAMRTLAALRFIHCDDMEAEGYWAYLDQVEERS